MNGGDWNEYLWNSKRTVINVQSSLLQFVGYLCKLFVSRELIKKHSLIWVLFFITHIFCGTLEYANYANTPYFFNNKV